MMALDLRRPYPLPGDPARLARLTRHLEARLGDFGTGGPLVLSSCQDTGRIVARFPNRSGQAIAAALEHNWGIQVAAEGEHVVFQLSPQVLFEDLDYLWGCLFSML